jgi:two-component system NtrC family sensor kinase
MIPPHILLVDDEPNILRALTRLFFDKDYELHTASSAQEGLEILKKQAVDLIIADYRMPGMTGIDFFHNARLVQPDAIRIILSGFADVHALTEAINEGNIYKFIFKPWNDEDLRTTVRLALDQRTLLLENRSLEKELKEKNRQLEEFNRELERKVEERSQEIQYRNKVLSVSQEILEHIPIGVIGYDDEGEVVIMNQQARVYFKPGIGRKLNDVLSAELASSCINLLNSNADSRHCTCTVDQQPFEVHLIRLDIDDTIRGGVIIFQEAAPLTISEVDPFSACVESPQ